jgi:hypothetical protein
MAIDAALEKRLEAIETAVADLQRRLGTLSAQSSWLDRFNGSFKDEPEFAKVVEYGRAFREADRPAQDGGT